MFPTNPNDKQEELKLPGTGFKGHDKNQHLSTSSRGGRSAHNPLKPKHKRCHEFNTKTASAAANKRWGNR